MARVVSGDREVLSQMMFGAPSMALQNYIQQTQQAFMGGLNHIGQQFMNVASNVFTRLDTSEAMQIARAALRQINVYRQHDIIDYLSTVEDIQIAPDIMVPYIMAHPTLSQYYIDGMVDGYHGRYHTPVTAQEVGWDNPYYCQVMNGVITEYIDEDGNECAEFVTPLDDRLDELPPLLDEEQNMILDTWDQITYHLKQKRDVTSIYDAEIQ